MKKKLMELSPLTSYVRKSGECIYSAIGYKDLIDNKEEIPNYVVVDLLEGQLEQLREIYEKIVVFTGLDCIDE